MRANPSVSGVTGLIVENVVSKERKDGVSEKKDEEE